LRGAGKKAEDKGLKRVTIEEIKQDLSKEAKRRKEIFLLIIAERASKNALSTERYLKRRRMPSLGRWGIGFR